jgi:tetratricopeptide (TPR) repeat protein
MGRLYLLAGEYEKAAERFRTALAIEPDYVFALRGLASSYLQAGQLDEAKDPLDRALAIEPDSAPGLFALAKYYACAGDRDRAVRTLIRSVEIGGDAFLDAALADEHLKELAEEYLGNGNEPRP